MNWGVFVTFCGVNFMNITLYRYLICLIISVCAFSAFNLEVDAKKISKTKTSAKVAKSSLNAADGKQQTAEVENQTEQNADNTAAEFPGFLNSPVIDVQAKQAILIDFETNTVLMQKNADQQMFPSSMTKIMTAYLVMKKLKEGVIKPDTMITVGEEGFRTEGSSMFLNVNDTVSVMDLLRGVIVQSGNDASIVLASYLSGSEAAFAVEMNRELKKMGAINTQFVNATGLPDANHFTTARDLTIVARHAILDFPEYYPLYSETEFTYTNPSGKSITQGNRNTLLSKKNMGCDGIKTGHTNIAGYGIVATVVHQGRRYVLVINGLPSMKAREQEAVKLMNWAKNNFTNIKISKSGETIAKVPVCYGDKDYAELTVAKDVVLALPMMAMNDLSVKISHKNVLEATLVKGGVVGEVTISSKFLDKVVNVPLVVKENVDRANIFKRIISAIKYLIFGFNFSDQSVTKTSQN